MQQDNPNLRRFARRMRREPTPAEEAVWRIVRGRRLARLKFRRQHPFGPYILDCYCPAARLVVELDGDSHATDGGQQTDATRTEYLAANGIRVLRFWNTEVADNPGGVAEVVVRECHARLTLQEVPV